MNIAFLFNKFVQNSLAIVVILLLAGCGGGGGGAATGADASLSNTVAVTVTGGLQNQSANLLVTSVTICVPGLSACKTVDNVQVDTGSTGLRLASSVLAGLELPRADGGAAVTSIFECAAFTSGYLWGGMAKADVKLGQEIATNVSIQLIQDNAGQAAPSGCQSLGPDLGVPGRLAVNGVLGVGSSPQDCGAYCTSVVANGRYFQCSNTSGCIATTVPLTSQVANPVASFARNNNGLVIELPGTPAGGARQVIGQMVFGINTQPNNTLAPDATLIPLAKTGPHAGRFSASRNGIAYPDSIIDSGASANFFHDPSLPICAGSAAMANLYCPGDGTSVAVQARDIALPGGAVVSIPVANAAYLFAQPAAAFGNLAGPGAGTLSTSIHLGLPFFMGRRVFTGLDSSANPNGPFIAYKN